MDGAGHVSAAKGAGVPAKPARPFKTDHFNRALAQARERRGLPAAVPPWAPLRSATLTPGVAPDAAFLARGARAETGAVRPGEGYGARNAASAALGRHQRTPLALRDLGWKDADGGWTALAARHGVGPDAEFLASPAVQEAAMGARLRRAEALLDRNGSLARSGGTVTGLDRASPLTEAVLVAAAHRRGAGSVGPLGAPRRAVERRLRDIAELPYAVAAKPGDGVPAAWTEPSPRRRRGARTTAGFPKVA